MKKLNDDKQMTDVWRLPAIGRWEKSCGKHPTQKPLSVLTRIILSCTDKGDWILDPFSGSSTTGIAANLIGRRFAGIEQSEEFCQMSKARREELDNVGVITDLKHHIVDLKILESKKQFDLFEGESLKVCEDDGVAYSLSPFDTKPVVDQLKCEEKCFLTCYVRKADLEIDAFLEHRATNHVTKIAAKANLAKAKYLFPLVKGSVDGYYKIRSIDVIDGKVHFSLGRFTRLGGDWIHVYGKMKPGELLNKRQCEELCNMIDSYE